MEIRIERSSLIMPVNVSRFVEKAWTRGVEQITLDLEDSVAPNQKEDARKLVKEGYREQRETDIERQRDRETEIERQR